MKPPKIVSAFVWAVILLVLLVFAIPPIAWWLKLWVQYWEVLR